MADIKTRDAVKGTIKTIDKAAVASERMKSAYSKIKSKAEQGYYADENSATEYAADKVSAASERITDEGVHQFNKQGQKGVKTTTESKTETVITETDDGHGNIVQTETAQTRTYLYITVSHKTAEEMADQAALSSFLLLHGLS